MKRVFRVLKFLLTLLLAYAVGFFARFFKAEYRNVWIISERGTDARDNGFFFYRYTTENHPEQPIWYVIETASADFPRVKAVGKYVERHSFRHYLLFAVARVRISTHAWGGDIPQPSYYQKLGLIRVSRKRFIFLQHGVTKDYLPALSFPNIRPDVFICGAAPEFEYIRNHFHHPDGVVRYTGLSRFDNLHQACEKRQILVMPTFRKWLQGMQESAFQEAQYYREWNALLNDPALHTLLLKYDLKLVFYPHYEMQKYVNLFDCACGDVILADFDHYDVQQLLMESMLLVTDFSSVFFDFAYMGKPVVYYQFDRQRYICEHYDFTKGYFSYDDHGFGEVVFDREQLIGVIETYIKSGFRVTDSYAARAERFFVLRDDENSKRIYERVSELQKGSK